MVIQAAKEDKRNLAWANDKSSFGQRMLAKMGWKDGKGLGKNQQGTSNHLVAVPKSEETLGIGATIDRFGGGGYEVTRDNFTGFLNQLSQTHTVSNENSGNDDDGSDSSKKKKHKKKKKQISKMKKDTVLAQNKVTAGHAAKMRKAKDLSTKSASDMAAIFGNVDYLSNTVTSPSFVSNIDTVDKKKKKKRKFDDTEEESSSNKPKKQKKKKSKKESSDK